MCVYAGRATRPAAAGEGAAAVGEGAAGTREEAEATGGGFREAGRTGGNDTHSHASCRGGQTHVDHSVTLSRRDVICIFSQHLFLSPSTLPMVSFQKATSWSSIILF